MHYAFDHMGTHKQSARLQHGARLPFHVRVHHHENGTKGQCVICERLQVYAPKPEALSAARAAVAAVEGTDMREGDVYVARVVQVRGDAAQTSRASVVVSPFVLLGQALEGMECLAVM